MFCKWCGEPTKAGQIKCRSCGRELPPISDCGGFYDLVTENSNDSPMPKPVGQGTGANAKVSHAPFPKKQKKRRLPNALFLLALLIVLLLIALTNVATNKKFSAMEAQNEKLIEQISALETKVQSLITQVATQEISNKNTTEQLAASQAPEESSEQPPVLSEKDISAEFSFEDPHNGMSASANYDLKNVSVNVCSKLHTEAAANRKTYTAECSMNDTMAFIAELRQTQTGEGLTFYAHYDIQNLDLLGEKSEIQYAWQWRENEEADWEPLSEVNGWKEAVSDEAVYIDDCDRSSRLDVRSREEFAALLHCDMPELRCVITRENSDGGSLTIYIGALSVKAADNIP